ncbi:DUF6432 family protein [Halobium salinum]|uniref:DUF6432 family protein n=1 Tax=Halobium salinum TaxID=1364940 RepID=A0ABD5PB55_9EURY|nr:DUF6432 family protein [Halobium salinum]
MRAKREYRDRAEEQVAVLDALVDRAEGGMTVFELRAAVDADIDRLEEALADLKGDGLISVEEEGGRTVIMPDERVVPDPGEAPEEEESLIDSIRERFGL